MREVVNIYVGQAGNQIGAASWELYCIEHEIDANGRLRGERTSEDEGFHTFFDDTPNGQFVPRGIFMDLEPTVIDEVRTGTYKKLFHPDQLISGEEDGANNFARGCYSIGSKFYDVTLDRLRRIVESCENIQAFILHHSYGGGTGSGFFSGLLDRISLEYGKRTKLSFGIFPSPTLSTAVVEPYNATLAMNGPIEIIDAAFLIDNESLYNVCKLNLSIGSPHYPHLNRIACQVLSALTSATRFQGILNADMMDFQTNLIPYPRIHFPMINYAPIISDDRADHQVLSTSELTRSVFLRESQMLKCDPDLGKYMSCCMLYRGDISPREVNAAVTEMKTKSHVNFVEWCPTGFKVGINKQPMVTAPGSCLAMTKRSVCMFSNNTAIGQAVSRLGRKFDLMFSKKAFVHWYVGEGMEEGEMVEGRDSVSGLERDYYEIAQDLDEAQTGAPADDDPYEATPTTPKSPPQEEGSKTDNTPNYEYSDNY